MDEHEDEYPTPWVAIIAGVLVWGCLERAGWGLFGMLVAIGVGRAAQYAYNLAEEWRTVNSSTGSLPRSSSILFWRRPRPRQE
jgi:hypothetical protein